VIGQIAGIVNRQKLTALQTILAIFGNRGDSGNSFGSIHPPILPDRC
jgi:hypothetical protein